jgi:hypothetical protein
VRERVRPGRPPAGPGRTRMRAAAAARSVPLAAIHVARGEPGPAAQLPGTGEAADVADLRDNDRAQHWADARQGLNRPVSLMPGQQVADDLLQQDDLAGQFPVQLP